MKTRLLFLMALFAFQFSFAKTLLVVDPITPVLSPLTYCDPNNDGFGEFDFEDINYQILAAQTGSASDYVITYHETVTQANTGSSPISSPYYNINSFTQMIYYRVRDVTTNLFAVGSFELVVNPKPIASTPTDISMCDDNNDGMQVFNLAPLVPQILGVNSPATSSVTFHNSQSNANFGSSPIVPINNYSGTNGEVIWARLTSDDTGCYDVVSFHLTVNPLPQTMQPNYPEYALCDVSGVQGAETFDLTSQINTILMGQSGMQVTFYPSFANAQSNTNPITNPSAYTNTIIYVQTLGIRVTNLATGCYSISTMDIKVNPLPQLTPPSGALIICDSDNDGFGLFDFTPILPQLTQGANYIITYHETLVYAEAGVNDFGTPYQNSNPFSQTLYIRAQDPVTGCYTVTPIILDVHASPQIVSPPVYEVCDTNFDTQAIFDLTTRIPIILGSLNPANYTVTFYQRLDDAEAGIGAITSANNYLAFSGELLSVRVEDNVTHCTSFVYQHLIVIDPPALTTPSPLSVCDDDANPSDQITTFNLTVKNVEITQSANYTVTYYPSLANAQSNTNAIADPTRYVNTLPAVQTLGVIVTSPYGCVSITTLDIRVMPIPTPLTNPPALVSQCDNNNPGDMLELFDLTVNQAYISNGDPNLTFHYFATVADAQDNLNEILVPTVALVGSNVWIRVENTRVDYQGNQCYILVEQPLRVNALPNPVIISDNTLNTVYVDTNNAVIRPLVLDTQLSGNYSFQWELDGNVVGTNSAYVVNTPSLNGTNRVYTVTVQDLSTGCTAASSITVLQSNVGVAPPLGAVSQTFNPGQTLANLNISGSTILWYATATNRTTLSTPLPLSTLLVDGTTYYASQTINGIESQARLPVTVHIALGVPTNEILPLQFAPNPVKNSLTLQSTQVLKSVMVYTMLGQKVFEQNCDSTEVTIDLSKLSAGNYILKAEGDVGQKTIRIIKE